MTKGKKPQCIFLEYHFFPKNLKGVSCEIQFSLVSNLKYLNKSNTYYGGGLQFQKKKIKLQHETLK